MIFLHVEGIRVMVPQTSPDDEIGHGGWLIGSCDIGVRIREFLFCLRFTRCEQRDFTEFTYSDPSL